MLEQVWAMLILISFRNPSCAEVMKFNNFEDTGLYLINFVELDVEISWITND